MNAKTVVRAFAPGSVGNIGPGLDIMGLALTGPGDTVEARVGTAPGVTVADPGHPDLPVVLIAMIALQHDLIPDLRRVREPLSRLAV